jgi:hypothetical protein
VNGVVRTLDPSGRRAAGHGRRGRGDQPRPVQDLSPADLSRDQAGHGRLREGAGAFKSFEPEAIHIATEGPIGLAARRICLEWKLPFTTSYHTRSRIRLGAPAGAARRRLRLHALVPQAVGPADGGHADHARRAGASTASATSRSGRAASTPSCSGRAAGEPDPFEGLKRPIFLNVGRVAVEKNIEAFVSPGPPGTKVVVGDGPAARGAGGAIPRRSSPAPSSARSWPPTSPAPTCSSFPRSPTPSAW